VAHLMLDRQKVETILLRRFAGATPDQLAAAANAIMGLVDEWEEVPVSEQQTQGVGRREDVEIRVLKRRQR
jgi:hypothetical protein